MGGAARPRGDRRRRSRPHDAAAATIDGITSFIAGAGGHSRYGVRADRRLAFADSRHDGALRLRLRRGNASYAFVSAGGRVLDRGSLRCRPVVESKPGSGLRP